MIAAARVGATTARIAVEEASAVAEARRRAMELGARAGLDAVRCGELAIGVTEAATNILKHARSGWILLGADAAPSGAGVEVVAIDRGPGLADLGAAMRDGHSTAGTAGTGLGAMRRLAREFEIYTRPGAGTAVRMWFAPAPRAERAWVVGAVSLPKPGEHECGDGWALRVQDDGCNVLVTDGLGHGPEAARASRVAAESFVAAPAWSGSEAWFARAHGLLRPTRGAAVGVAELESRGARVRYTGVGNVTAAVVDGDRVRHLVSQNGIVGHEMRKVQTFEQPFGPGALLVLHTDGLTTRWTLASHPGLAQRHPSLIAAVLHRDHARGRDDATVVVLRAGAAAGAARAYPAGAPHA